MVYRIIKVAALQVHNYTDKQGNPATWKSKGFILSDGRNNFYGEAQQAVAESLETLALKGGEVVVGHIRFNAREYEVNGVKRYSNEAIIESLMIISKS